MPKNGDGSISKLCRGEWVIYTKDGVIVHHSDYRTMTQEIDLQSLVVRQLYFDGLLNSQSLAKIDSQKLISGLTDY